MGTPIGELVLRKPIAISDLSGRRIGFDSFNILYQFLSNIRGPDGEPLQDSQGNVTSHLTGLLYRTSNLVVQGVKPVFVFDGVHSHLKTKTIQARKAIRTAAAEKVKIAREAGDLETARKFASQSGHLTPVMVADAKRLVELLGFPVVQAPGEGEAQLAFMVQKGDLFAGVSQDMDALLFGCPRLVRNLAVSGKRKLPGRNVYVDVEPELIELSKVLSELEIDRKKLVWMGILVGTDFNEKFPKIGPKTALKLVKSHDSFESIISQTKFEPDFDFREIEKLFLEPEQFTDYKLEFKSPDKEGVIRFLCDGHNFSTDRVESVLNKLSEKASEKGQQSRLGNWS